MGQKWASEAGPIQTKKVDRALREISTAYQTHTEITGVQDGRTPEQVVADYVARGGRRPDGSYDVSVSTYISFNIGGTDKDESGQKAKAAALSNALGERFAWTITRANYTQVIAGAEAVVADILSTKPIKDKRDTPEKKAEQEAHWAAERAKTEAAEKARTEVNAAILSKKPAAAKALIIARYNEDTSDMQTDYSGHATVGEYAIGWRFGSREDFKQLRAAAQAFLAVPREDIVQTCPGGSEKHPCRHRGGMYSDSTPRYEGEGPHPIYAVVNGDEYAKITEHRDNYSMGGGNYLSDHDWDRGGTGWVIRSVDVGDKGFYGGPYIDALPDGPKPTQDGGDREASGATVSPSRVRAGYVEVAFPSRPEPEVLSELKSAGFRWAMRTKTWYGPVGRLPERYQEGVAA